MTRLVPILLTLLLTWVPVAHAETILVAADEWCPYNCTTGDTEGYVVDILRAIFEKEDIGIDYKILGWNRTLEEARAGHVTAAIGVSKAEVEGFVLPEEEIGIDCFAYYVRSYDDWQYTGDESLLGRTIAVADGYDLESLHKFAAAHKFQMKVYSSRKDDPARHNLQLLIHNRVDVVYDDDKVLQYQIHLLDLQQEVRRAGVSEFRDKLYVAFSPANPNSPRYVRLFDEGIRAMRENGQLSTILQRYGLEDWK